MKLLASEVVEPRVDIRTLAPTGGEPPGSTIVGWVADEATATSSPGLGLFTAELGRLVDGGQGLWESGELQDLLAGDKVNVRQLQNGVDKVEEASLPVLVAQEPGCVDKDGEGRLSLGVIVEEVAGEHSLDPVWTIRVNTGVRHRALDASLISLTGHGDLPQAWVGLDRAGLDDALVGHGMVQSVGPAGRCLLRGGVPNGQAGVIGELVLGQHSHHCVSSSGQEGSPHAFDVFGVHASVTNQHLTLTNDLIGPPLLAEPSSVGVGHTVRGNLVACCVQVVYCAVVSPLVRHVKSGLDGTSVGVEPVVEQPRVEGDVSLVDSIVEGQQHQLRDLFFGHVAWNGRSSTIAVGYLAQAGVTLASILRASDRDKGQSQGQKSYRGS